MLTNDRPLQYKQATTPEFGYPVQAGSRVYRGGMVALCDDGTIVPAGTAVPTSPIAAVIGIAEHIQDNSITPTLPAGLSGSNRVRVRRGCFPLPFDAAPPFSAINATVYAIDDQTVTLTQGAHLAVGKLVGFDENNNPWVQV